MPRPFKGGKKKTRGKRRRAPRQGPLVLKEENSDIDQLYGKVVNRLGGRPPIILVDCEDGLQRKCVVRGKMIKRGKNSYCNPGDIVLINYNKGLEGGEIEKKYLPRDVTKLKNLGEISESTFKSQSTVTNNDIVFSNLANEQTMNESGDIDDEIKALTESYLNDTQNKNQDDFDFNFDNV